MSTRWNPARPFDALGLAVVASFFALIVLVLTGGRAEAAEPTQVVIDEAHAMIVGSGANKGNDKLVMSFCYPTAKSLTKVEYVTGTTANDGSFTLTYRYLYRDSDNDPADFQLKFYFNAKAKMTDVRTLTGKHSSFWPPMSTAEITLAVVKEAIRNDDKLRDQPVWKELLKVDAASDFLVGVINIKAGK